jgi:hypothetical protein
MVVVTIPPRWVPSSLERAAFTEASKNYHIAMAADSDVLSRLCLARRHGTGHVGRMSPADRHALQVLPLEDAPLAGIRVYRVPVVGRAIAVAVFAAPFLWGLAAWLAGRISLGGAGILPLFMLGWIGFWLALILLFFVLDLRKALSPQAWLARLTDDGVFIKLRSYQNAVATGSQVLFVPFSAIRSANALRKTWVTRAERGGTVERRQECVDIAIDADISLALLDAALDVERAGEYARKRPSGSRTIWRHYPVSIEPGNVVRVEWRARPAVDDFLSYLGAHARIGEGTDSASDLRVNADDASLRELARRGEVMELVRVIHVRDGGSLAAARERAERMIVEG